MSDAANIAGRSERLHARRVPRWLGAGVALALLMLVLLAVLLLIVPVIT